MLDAVIGKPVYAGGCPAGQDSAMAALTAASLDNLPLAGTPSDRYDRGRSRPPEGLDDGDSLDHLAVITVDRPTAGGGVPGK